MATCITGAHSFGTPANDGADIAADLNAILAGCFAYKPHDRTTAEGVATALRSALERHDQRLQAAFKG